MKIVKSKKTELEQLLDLEKEYCSFLFSSIGKDFLIELAKHYNEANLKEVFTGEHIFGLITLQSILSHIWINKLDSHERIEDLADPTTNDGNKDADSTTELDTFLQFYENVLYCFQSSCRIQQLDLDQT